MFECQICGHAHERFKTIEGLYNHLETQHADDIPDGWTVQQYAYYLKTGKANGTCIMCKGHTKFNSATGKYCRLCGKKACDDKNRKIFEERMIGRYGKVSLLNDPDHQKKMLANRKISGMYEWSDNVKKGYTGTYELDYLRLLDVLLNFPSDDVITPSPHTYYYEYNGKTHFYIPDVYITSLNAEIEIKDGGNNPNMHHKIQAIDKVKEKLKDDVMTSQRDVSYIKVAGKNYEAFFDFLFQAKDQFTNTSEKDEFVPIFIIGESVETVNGEIMTESMKMAKHEKPNHLYHVSENDDLEGQWLKPRIPDNYMVINGYEENETPRISFSDTVEGCLTGLATNVEGKIFTVYELANYDDAIVYRPSEKEVPGSVVYGEYWMLNKCKLFSTGKIKVIESTRPYSYKYDNGKKKAELWGWKYVELDHHNNHQQLVNSLPYAEYQGGTNPMKKVSEGSDEYVLESMTPDDKFKYDYWNSSFAKSGDLFHNLVSFAGDHIATYHNYLDEFIGNHFDDEFFTDKIITMLRHEIIYCDEHHEDKGAYIHKEWVEAKLKRLEDHDDEFIGDDDEEMSKLMQEISDMGTEEIPVLESSSLAYKLATKNLAFMFGRPYHMFLSYTVNSKREFKKLVKNANSEEEIDDAINRLKKYKVKYATALKWRMKHGNVVPLLDKGIKKSISDDMLKSIDRYIDELEDKKRTSVKESVLDDSNYIDRMADNKDSKGKHIELKGYEKPYEPEAMQDALASKGVEEIFFGADYHISYFSEEDEERVNLIIDGINSTVGEDDHFVIVGDLSDKETGSLKDTKKFVSKIKCKNIYLILGNNDVFSMKEYIGMGFKTVSDYIIMTDRTGMEYIITHFPVSITRKNVTNIHAHLHGARQYLDADPKNHIDVWCGNTTFVPKKGKEYIRLMNVGYFE